MNNMTDKEVERLRAENVRWAAEGEAALLAAEVAYYGKDRLSPYWCDRSKSTCRRRCIGIECLCW